MALLDAFKKKNTEKKEKPAETATRVKPRSARRATLKETESERYSHVLLRPLVSEKASFLTTENEYTFEVRADATKTEIKKAIREIYRVTPVGVHVITVPPKRIRVRGKEGIRPRGRKAVVFLKEGDRINFV
ncbi:MAG: 50S ribosomal protein L23 [Parcubacteria group bacterium]|nr:50S ribosomal protein L23 [Parcubacteria group bacterium]